MRKRNALVEQVRTWEGVPYKDKGRDRGGVDCIGLLILAAKDARISGHDTLNYPRRPVPRDFLRELKGHMDRIQKREAGHGDVLVFEEPRHPCHVGVLEADARGQLWVWHAYAVARKVVRERMTDERWSRARMAFRVPGDD
jgi:cell wall-associated NlpC family hydrolase